MWQLKHLFEFWNTIQVNCKEFRIQRHNLVHFYIDNILKFINNIIIIVVILYFNK